jgi:hypothetical protein
LAAGTESEWQVKRCRALDGDLRQLELEIADRTVGRLPEP